MTGKEPVFCTWHGPEGKVLRWVKDSGVRLIGKDGLYFKDLAKDGVLHPYEDWRLSSAERAADLASRMTVEQIAGLMLYSSHQNVPGNASGPFGGVTYGGLPYSSSGEIPAWSVSDQQRQFLGECFIRHVLLMRCESAETAARWNNGLQACAEALPWGIPVNISSDPRHGTNRTFEFNEGAGGDISHWPEPLGLAAAFDPESVRHFGEVASKEYRAMGISTALSPQIDPATEPRWWRFDGTFGSSPRLSAQLARAYCDGLQQSDADREIDGGWGWDSVNAMVKHWPGGGTGEGGRDAHYGCGKYNVYPGNNFAQHMIPFTEGAFRLAGKTGSASAVMPYYSVSWDQDKVNGENVGNSYSGYMIHDLLRVGCAYDQVVCTDWGITGDEGPLGSFLGGKCWGVQHLSQAERCLKVLMSGVDQFGGLNDKTPILAAYEIGVQRMGETAMRRRFETSARRLLTNIFRTGLFEDPYLSPDETRSVVGCAAHMQAGYEAQLRSIVMLKNSHHVLPLNRRTKVYIPVVDVPEQKDFLHGNVPASSGPCLDPALVGKYFEMVDDPAQADAALCFIHAPGGMGFVNNPGYSDADRASGGNGYVPVSLQYRPYTAEHARAVSIAGGDSQEDTVNRSYRGKTTLCDNEFELDLLLETRRRMGGKPVILLLKTGTPLVMQEVEPLADAILLEFGDLNQAALEIAGGGCEPSALLPMQMPADMRTVEEHCEDVPFDLRCHVDTDGHVYDFAYGMNWSGVIDDERVARFRQPSRLKKS